MPKMIEGAYYENRQGKVVGPAEKLTVPGVGRYPWFVAGWTFDELGRFSYSPNERDLVKQVSEPGKECAVGEHELSQR